MLWFKNKFGCRYDSVLCAYICIFTAKLELCSPRCQIQLLRWFCVSDIRIYPVYRVKYGCEYYSWDVFLLVFVVVVVCVFSHSSNAAWIENMMSQYFFKLFPEIDVSNNTNVWHHMPHTNTHRSRHYWPLQFCRFFLCRQTDIKKSSSSFRGIFFFSKNWMEFLSEIKVAERTIKQ